MIINKLKITGTVRPVNAIAKFSTKVNLVNFLFDFILERLLRQRISRTRSTDTEDFFVKTADFIGAQIMAHDLYEKRELETLVKYLTPIHPILKHGISFDVGANIGNHTLFLAPFFSEIHAFEPNPKLTTLLKLNTRNVVNIKIYEFGLASLKSHKILYINSENVGGSSTVKGRGVFNEQVEIQLLPLDSLEIDCENLQLIKIDVEGNEYEVLMGGRDTIQQSMPIILLEQFPSDFDSMDKNSIALLKSFGYKFSWMAPDSINQNMIQRRARKIYNLVKRREVTFLLTDSEVPRGHYPMLIAVPPRFFSPLALGKSDGFIHSL
jgi:FkbM family methyltransferase